jgi:hypothetical protein
MPISHDPRFLPLAAINVLHHPSQSEPYQAMEEPRKLTIRCPRNSVRDVMLGAAYREEKAYPYKGATYWIYWATRDADWANYELLELVPPRRMLDPDELVAHILNATSVEDVDELRKIMADAPPLQLQVGPPLRKLALGSTPTVVCNEFDDVPPPPASPGPVVRALQQLLDDEFMDIVDLLPGEPPARPAPPAVEMVESREQQAVQRALQQPQHQRAGLLGPASHYDW